MGELRFDDRVHEFGEHTPVPDTIVSQALAWWIAADLVRRHPGELTVLETHPGGGQYNCISVFRRPPQLDLVVHMNVDPGAHLTHASWFGDDSDEDRRFNWLEVLLCANRRAYVTRQLEDVEGLGSPKPTPATTDSTIGPMVIAAFLARSMLSRGRWRAVNGVCDSEYGVEVRGDLFDQVPGVAEATRASAIEGEEQPESRVWFVGPEGESEWSLPTAAFAVDTQSGLLWRAGESKGIDLLAEYRTHGRSLDALVSSVCPPAF